VIDSTITKIPDKVMYLTYPDGTISSVKIPGKEVGVLCFTSLGAIRKLAESRPDYPIPDDVFIESVTRKKLIRIAPSDVVYVCTDDGNYVSFDLEEYPPRG
jgi:hypothetical protein